MLVDIIILLSIFIIILGIKLFFKAIEKNSIRCCGDCETYEKCWNNIYDKDCYETPACDNFLERNSDYNRD